VRPAAPRYRRYGSAPPRLLPECVKQAKREREREGHKGKMVGNNNKEGEASVLTNSIYAYSDMGSNQERVPGILAVVIHTIHPDRRGAGHPPCLGRGYQLPPPPLLAFAAGFRV
jgi:hypothetical protein